MLRSSRTGSPQSRGGPVIPRRGTAEHETKVPDDLIATLRQLADALAIPFSSVLLAAHAKVLSALSGELEVATGYVARPGGQPLPCRLTTEAESWRALLLDTHRVEAELLSHADFPVDELRHELGVAGPAFEDRLRPDRCGRRPFVEYTVLRVGISRDDGQPLLRLRYRTEVLDADCAARIAGYHLTALELMAADWMLSTACRACCRRRSFTSSWRVGWAAAGAAGPPGPRAVRAAGGGSS